TARAGRDADSIEDCEKGEIRTWHLLLAPASVRNQSVHWTVRYYNRHSQAGERCARTDFAVLLTLILAFSPLLAHGQEATPLSLAGGVAWVGRVPVGLGWIRQC